jgi:thiaminase/transcriptional activator TenA
LPRSTWTGPRSRLSARPTPTSCCAPQAAGPPAEPRYRQWVETYADPGFAELAAWCAGLLDRVAAGLPPERVAACERAFRTNLDHELAFWDA